MGTIMKQGFPPGVHLVGGRKAAVAHMINADEFYAPIVPIVVELREGGMSLGDIARELGERQVEMRQGGTAWNPAQVRRILQRAGVQTATRTPSAPSPESTTAPVAPMQAIPQESPPVERHGDAPRSRGKAVVAAELPPACAEKAVASTQTPAGDITLSIRGRSVGPYSIEQVEQILAAGVVDLDANFTRPGVAGWRKLKELLSAK